MTSQTIYTATVDGTKIGFSADLAERFRGSGTSDDLMFAALHRDMPDRFRGPLKSYAIAVRDHNVKADALTVARAEVEALVPETASLLAYLAEGPAWTKDAAVAEVVNRLAAARDALPAPVAEPIVAALIAAGREAYEAHADSYVP
jgi:hypothetical protein